MGLHANPQVNLIRCRIKAMLNMQAHAGDFGQNKLKKTTKKQKRTCTPKNVAKTSKEREKVAKWKKGLHFYPEMR